MDRGRAVATFCTFAGLELLHNNLKQKPRKYTRSIVWPDLFPNLFLCLFSHLIFIHSVRLNRKDTIKMFRASSKLTSSIALRNNATSITRQWASSGSCPCSSKTDSCTCASVSEALELMDEARHNYNSAQRLLRKVEKHESSTENVKIARNALKREQYKHERVVLQTMQRLREKVQDKPC